MVYEEILAAQQQRDQRDLGRKAGPLKTAEDAMVIDTTRMSVDEVVEKLYEIVSGDLSVDKR